MILKMLAVFDRVAKAYVQPHFVLAEGLAVRAIANAIKDPSHRYHLTPENHILFRICEFDESTGLLQRNQPEPVVSFTELAARSEAS